LISSGNHEIPTADDRAAVSFDGRRCILARRHSTEDAVGAFSKDDAVSIRLSHARQRDVKITWRLSQVQDEAGSKTCA